MINAQGRTLAGTGYPEPIPTLNLSYRRNITQALSLVLNVTDVFSSQKMETVTDSTMLKERAIRRFDGRIAYIGLSYRFGGVQGQPRREGRGVRSAMGRRVVRRECNPLPRYLTVAPAQAGGHAELPKSVFLKYWSCFPCTEFCYSAWVPPCEGTTGQGSGFKRHPGSHPLFPRSRRMRLHPIAA
jgi:hypothetical protein